MLVPVTCPLCGRFGAAPCGPCIGRLRPAARTPAPAGLDGLVCLLDYDEVSARLVGALKYRNARRLVPWLSSALAGLVPPEVDIVTWAPTTTEHRRRRGFDQAQVLARATARCLGLPSRRLLVRVGRRSQTGRRRRERLRGVAFAAVPTVAPPSVVIIDDVVTTGATLGSAAQALRSAGVERVVAVTVARTPPIRLTRSSRVRLESAGTRPEGFHAWTSRSAAGTPRWTNGS